MIFDSSSKLAQEKGDGGERISECIASSVCKLHTFRTFPAGSQHGPLAPPKQLAAEHAHL